LGEHGGQPRDPVAFLDHLLLVAFGFLHRVYPFATIRASGLS
jgi:hypothetical protein